MTAPGGEVPDLSPGPDAIAGEILLRTVLELADVDERTREIIESRLSPVLPGRLLPPGTVVDRRTLRRDDLTELIGSAVIVAAGLDPAKTRLPPLPVLWDERGNRLLVHIAGVRAELGTGLVEFTIPVECDQTGATDVTVTFVTGAPDRPSGGVTTTEDHPRGAEIVVENWHEQLIALAWHTLLIATSAMAKVGSPDWPGRPLITNGFEVAADGLAVVPMARHTFMRTGIAP